MEDNRINFKATFRSGLDILLVALAATGLAFLFAAIITAVFDWIPFLPSLVFFLVFWFCLLQLKSWFYRHLLLPAGAAISALMLLWLVVGKPGITWFENNHIFLVVQISRGADALETQVGFRFTGTGKASKAKREVLDAMSYYEDHDLMKEVTKLNKERKFEEAAKLISDWGERHQKTLKHLESKKEATPVASAPPPITPVAPVKAVATTTCSIPTTVRKLSTGFHYINPTNGRTEYLVALQGGRHLQFQHNSNKYTVVLNDGRRFNMWDANDVARFSNMSCLSQLFYVETQNMVTTNHEGKPFKVAIEVT